MRDQHCVVLDAVNFAKKWAHNHTIRISRAFGSSFALAFKPL
jgi:hypothetical protein